MKVLEIHARKPIVIITWKGTNPELPSLMLNSHMDVVPVFPVGIGSNRRPDFHRRSQKYRHLIGILEVWTV